MRIAVFGTGGVGGYFGARLAKSGQDVWFIARGNHLRAIEKNGLKVESAGGDFVVKPANATDDPLKAGQFDLIIVGVKAWQVPDAAREMLPMIGPGTSVLPLQNGVDAADQLAEIIGREHLLGGLCHIISFVSEPGVIRHAGYEPKIIFGELDDSESGRAKAIQDVFADSGVSVKIAPNIQAALWGKLLFIAPYSGVGAVTRVTAGVIRTQPETRQLLEAAMGEVFRVALARGVALPTDAVQRSMEAVDSLPAEGTSSMQRDVMAGRPSELVSQNGAVVRLGRDVNEPTPVNSFIFAALLPSELIARGNAGIPKGRLDESSGN